MKTERQSNIVHQNNNQLNVSRGTLKYFVGDNLFRYYTYTNGTAGAVEIKTGDVMVFSPATNEVKVFDSSSPSLATSDRLVIVGSADIKVDVAGTANIRCCSKGKYNSKALNDQNALPYLRGNNSDLDDYAFEEIGKYQNPPV